MRKTWFYRHAVLPILVLIIRFCLAWLGPILPESIIDEGENVLDQFYGTSHQPDKILRLARKLSAEYQAMLYGYAQQMQAYQQEREAAELDWIRQTMAE